MKKYTVQDIWASMEYRGGSSEFIPYPELDDDDELVLCRDLEENWIKDWTMVAICFIIIITVLVIYPYL